MPWKVAETVPICSLFKHRACFQTPQFLNAWNSSKMMVLLLFFCTVLTKQLVRHAEHFSPLIFFIFFSSAVLMRIGGAFYILF